MKAWRNGVEIPCKSSLYEALVDCNLLQYGDTLTTKISWKMIGGGILHTATNEGKYLCHFTHDDDDEPKPKFTMKQNDLAILMGGAIALVWLLLKQLIS